VKAFCGFVWLSLPLQLQRRPIRRGDRLDRAFLGRKDPTDTIGRIMAERMGRSLARRCGGEHHRCRG